MNLDEKMNPGTGEWIWDDGFEVIWVDCMWMRWLFGLMDGW